MSDAKIYSIKKELTALRPFLNVELTESLKGWRCYSEDEISAVEEWLHIKLPAPIRDIYRYMADLLVIGGYLRPLELLHWEGDFLGFFLVPGQGEIVGIQGRKPSGELYTWEEDDPEYITAEYEDELVAACEDGDEEEKQRVIGEYRKYWEAMDFPSGYTPLGLYKLENEPRFNHMLDGHSLFLVLYAIREWEEMTWSRRAKEPTCLFSEFFPARYLKEDFENIADRIKEDFIPLSDHLELTELADFPLQMAYIRKDQEALLILGDQPVCFMLLTKTAAGQELLEKMKEQTGLAFRVGF